ncbi:IS3 family transposase [Treponema parvum]|uniref:IS3 family transposase n=1 Tax=Treponema parvum TaxID=138851 RepID=UPI00211F2E5A|nr:IS3 family transposase [Treponema parvum]
MENAKEKIWSIVKMCSTLKVSETGFYKWKRNRNKIKSWQLLLVEIYKILSQDPENDNYGIQRIRLALEQRGIKLSRSTVIRAMRKGNLLHKSRRSPDGLTKADRKAQRPENLLKGDFSADAPNKKWLTDITQVPCKDGKLYIAPMMDCFAGEIVAVAMDDNMKKELCIKALKEAYELRKPDDGLIHHSDAGSQYTSEAYKSELARRHAIQSMSGVGKCYDNARMESFFATLKKEKLYRIDTTKLKREEVKKIVWRFIVYYNRRRITTINPKGYPPAIYRELFETALSKPAA